MTGCVPRSMGDRETASCQAIYAKACVFHEHAVSNVLRKLPSNKGGNQQHIRGVISGLDHENIMHWPALLRKKGLYCAALVT